MNKILHVSAIQFLFIFLFLLVSNGKAQQQEWVDNPKYDHVPPWYFDTINNMTKQPATVVTVDGYDNFNLGVDFAEGHISVNPMAPAQFFTAFNTDEPHGTIDGHEWYAVSPAWGASVWGDPVTAYDSLGNLYYENMYGGGSILGCKVAKSTDNGQSWNTAVTAISGIDKCWIAADQTSGPYANYVYATMTGNGVGNFARTTNNGVSWTNTYTFSTQSLPGEMVCVGPDGNTQGGAVYVVTNGGSTFNSTYTFYRSLNGGSSFQFMSSQNFAGYVGVNSNGRHSVENMRTRPYPFIAADNSYGPFRGRLYCVYATNDPPGNGNKPDIWSRYSDNGGSSWSAAVRVNDDVNPTAHHQFEPAPWCDKETGRLYIQWMDTRDTPTSDSALIYGTYSDDGGQSFMPNVAISNQKMRINCTTCGGGGSPRYQGDYNGITSNSKVSMATWGDFRYGSFASFTGYFPDFALRLFPEELGFTYQDTVWAVIPDVKLYNDTAIFMAEAEEPPSGSFSVDFPMGNMLTTFPDSIPIVITANNVALGEYTLYVDGMGPNGTPIHKREATLILAELPLPIVEFSASDTAICSGSSVNFTDETQFFPTQWFWSFPGGTPSSSNEQNPSNIVYNEPGTYDVSLHAVNSSGFAELTKTDYIEVTGTPGPPEGDDVYACLPGTVPPLQVTGDNVSWYDTPDLSNVIFTGNIFETEITDPGTYTFYVTQNPEGCESNPLTITLHVNMQPTASLNPFDPVCDSDVEFTLTGGMPAGGIYYGTGVNSGLFDPGVSGAGTFTIGYIYTDTNQCSDTAFQDILVNASPVFELGNDTSICANLNYTLDASAVGAASYLWSPGNQTTASITVDSSGVGLNPQLYSVLVTGNNGCTNSDAVTVTFIDCAGVNEISGLQSAAVYPNPNGGEFTLQLSAVKHIHLDVRLMNETGKILLDLKDIPAFGNTQHKFSVPDLSSGVYYLVLQNNVGRIMKKVMVN